MKWWPDRESPRTSQKWLVIVSLVALAAAASIWTWRWNTTADRRDEIIPRDYHFRCPKCDHRWTDGRETVTRAFGGGMPTTLTPVNCTSCRKKVAYLMARCPWCREHYVHPHLLTGRPGQPTTDICPHCRKDTLTWRGE